MTPFGDIFDSQTQIDPTQPASLDAQLAAVPDRPGVYLLATADDQPVLLAMGLAVRSILRRRLGEPVEPPPQDELAESPGTAPQSLRRPARSKRADLRPIVRKLYLKSTFSPFETDLWHLWLARRVFPRRYRDLIRRRHCWMALAQLEDGPPRLSVTDRFEPPGGRRVGPMPTRQAAGRLVDLLTHLFELCHYYQVLRQAPHGRPCEYKEMGRCLGPCDGTISMDAYRHQVAEAIAFAADAGRQWRGEQEQAMRQAASLLRFEQAGRIKDRLARAAELAGPQFAWLADVERMDFLVVQPGRIKDELRTFRGFGGRVVVGPTLSRKNPAAGLTDWLALSPPPPDVALRGEEAALLSDYLFRSERDRGLFVRFEGQSADQLAATVAEQFPPTVRRKGTTSPPAD